MKLKKRLITIFIITILLFTGLSNNIVAKNSYTIIYVDDDNTQGPWKGTLDYPYRYLQDAIENASSGDTIRVYEGVYINPENNVYITKSLNIIGNGSDDTFIGRLVSIAANNVFFRGFTINGSDYKTMKKTYCIRMKGSDNCDINNNTLASGLCGIELYDSTDINIENNIIKGRESYKPHFYLSLCNRITIRDNHIIEPQSICIYLEHCQDNIIDRNTIYTSSSRKLFLRSCNNNTIINNTNCSFYLTSSSYNKIINNTQGGSLSGSNNNIIIGNNLSSGITLYGSNYNRIDTNIFNKGEKTYILVYKESNNNIITHNSLINNTRGSCICLKYAYENVIQFNDIVKNKGNGITIGQGSINNTICHNNIQENGNKSKSWTGGIVFDKDYWAKEKSFGNVICSNNIQNNVVGLNISFTTNSNIIEKNNFIGNDRNADFRNSWRNTWYSNYWDDWIGFGPKFILGSLGQYGKIPWVNIDRHAAKEPYDI